MKSVVGKSNCGSMKLPLPSYFSKLQLVRKFNIGCIEELLVGCTTQLLRRETQILEQFSESLVVN